VRSWQLTRAPVGAPGQTARPARLRSAGGQGISAAAPRQARLHWRQQRCTPAASDDATGGFFLTWTGSARLVACDLLGRATASSMPRRAWALPAALCCSCGDLGDGGDSLALGLVDGTLLLLDAHTGECVVDVRRDGAL
jgi:hypothetical protein